jgi:hypothetical protein
MGARMLLGSVVLRAGKLGWEGTRTNGMVGGMESREGPVATITRTNIGGPRRRIGGGWMWNSGEREEWMLRTKERQ